jgi:general secretion pathway protein K
VVEPQLACSSANAQRGAALLLAMMVLALVATLAAGMVWQQSRAVQVEAAERGRAQLAWMLMSGTDFAREVLRRNATADPKREQPWDQPLQETRLSALLAADRNNNADAALEAFISGRIEDAQSRYNLRNVMGDDGKLVEAEVKGLQRLCAAIGQPGLADRLLPVLAQVLAPPGTAGAPGAGSSATPAIEPRRVEDLVWAGIDSASLKALARVADILPGRTPLNLNTAPAEAIVAAVDADLGTAARLVRQRNNRFGSLEEASAAGLLPQGVTLAPSRVAVRSTHFVAWVSVRIEERALSDRVLLVREGEGSQAQVRVSQRLRQPTVLAGS